MKITELNITGYQGINALSLSIDKPLVLVAGKNATGKSSLRDAIEFAFTGLSSRVALKKDYGQLVRIGSDPKKAAVDMTVDGFTYKRQVYTGRAGHEDRDYPAVLAHLLGSTHFATIKREEQARLLFEATGVKRDPAAVRKLLIQQGITEACIDVAMPMLRAGFAAAVKACKEQQSRKRGGWEAITDERFGEAKAVNWVATVAQTGTLKELEAAQAEFRKAIPALEADINEREQQKQDIVQHTHSPGVVYDCPECKAKLIMLNRKLVLDERDGETEPPFDEQKALIEEINGLRRDLQEIQQSAAQTDLMVSQAQNAEKVAQERTEKAAKLLTEYGEWKAAAEALGPTGIPLTLLEAGIKPINDRLADTSLAAGWKPIVIASDLSISYGGINYLLCSESERWRIDAAITEALALLSNVKLFVLDRMDVLHPADRGSLVNWLIKVSPEHDTIIVMATLKTQPTSMPEPIQTVWLDEGGQIALEQAA